MVSVDQAFTAIENAGFRSLLELLEPRYALPSPHYISDTAGCRQFFLNALQSYSIVKHIHWIDLNHFNVLEVRIVQLYYLGK